MAKLGAIKNKSVITCKETTGTFNFFEYMTIDSEMLLVFVGLAKYQDENLITPITTFSQFIAHSLNKKKKDVTAEDFYLLSIDGLSWPDFRRKYIRLQFEVVCLVFVNVNILEVIIEQVIKEKADLMKMYPRIVDVGVSNDIASKELLDFLDAKEANLKPVMRVPDEILIYLHVDDVSDWTNLPRSWLGCRTTLMMSGKLEYLMTTSEVAPLGKCQVI